MEILDEYDNEYPLMISFCERITPQDFEGQSMNYTQKALQDLFAQMEQNPSICERVVRKKKQEEKENAGLGQYLTAKFFAMLQGDVNYANALGEIEMQERVEQLKCEMKKANKYARAARRASWRPPERRTRRAFMLGGFRPRQNRYMGLQSVPDMPQIFGTFPKQMERSMNPNMDLRQLWAGMSSVNQKSMFDLRPLMLNPDGFRPTLLGNSPVGRMRYSNPPRFPSNSPASSSQTPSASSYSSTSIFNTPVMRYKGNKEDDNDHDAPGSSGA